MKLLLIFMSPLLVFAKVHYAKVEPYESVLLKSAVSALVLDVDLGAEGTMVLGKKIIHLDDKLDIVNLDVTKKNITFLNEIQDLNKEIEKSLKSTMVRQKNYYTRINNTSTASKTQKDNAYSTYTSAKIQYLNTKEKIINLDKQILDLGYKKIQLEDSIDKKSIHLEGRYLYKLIVRKGDFVNFGSPLAQVYDVNKAKLVLFLELEEVEEIDVKKIYLNGKKTEYKVDKIWKVTDEKFISSYRAEIYIPAPKSTFSELMKIEIK